MANKVWTFFKKLGHWISVGAQDIDKFEQAVAASGILNLIPGGAAIQAGFGVFEKIFLGVKDVQSTFSAANLADNGPAKLLAATPKAVQAFLDFANAIDMKVTDPVKLQTIATGYASLTADFWNILEPKTGDKLPTPNVPATPAPASTPTP
jgi:hypothetical protein